MNLWHTSLITLKSVTLRISPELDPRPCPGSMVRISRWEHYQQKHHSERAKTEVIIINQLKKGPKDIKRGAVTTDHITMGHTGTLTQTGQHWPILTLMARKAFYYDGYEPRPDAFRDGAALMLESSKDNATIFVFEEVGKTKGGDMAKKGNGGFLEWRYPNSWMVCNRKSHYNG